MNKLTYAGHKIPLNFTMSIKILHDQTFMTSISMDFKLFLTLGFPSVTSPPLLPSSHLICLLSIPNEILE